MNNEKNAFSQSWAMHGRIFPKHILSLSQNIYRSTLGMMEGFS